MQLKATLVLLLIAALVIVDVDAWGRRRRRRRRRGFFRRLVRTGKRIYRTGRRIWRRYPIVRRAARWGFRYIKRRYYDLRQLRMEDEDAYEELIASLEHDVVEDFGEDIAGDLTEALDTITDLDQDEFNEAEANVQDDGDLHPEYDVIESMIRKQLDASN